MHEKRPLSIQTALCLAIAVTVASTVLGAGALFEYQLHRARMVVHNLRAATLAEAYAAQMLPYLQGRTAKETSDFVEQIPRPTGVCFLAAIDTEGRILGLRGPDSVLKSYLDMPEDRRPANKPCLFSMPDPFSGSADTLELAAMPIMVPDSGRVLGTVLCAAAPIPNSLFTSRQAWPFFLGLALIALIGFVLGSLYLHHSVVKPLVLLSTRSGKPGSSHVPAAILDHLPGEIGDLARTLAELQADVEQWRQRNDRLQHDFAARIQSETARMTRELRRTERKAWTDPLTRLGNRRLLDDKLIDIFESRKRTGDDLAMIMIDIDNFKTLNDTMGHKAGDDLLKFIGDLLRQCVREEDLAIRCGGDEFLLILPGASAAEARVIAERTVRLFAQQTRLLRVNPRPSMSAGVASYREHRPATPEALQAMADAALYAAKHAGKSQVLLFDPQLDQRVRA